MGHEGSSVAIYTSDRTKRYGSNRFLKVPEECNLPVETDEEKRDYKSHEQEERLSSRFHSNFIKKVNMESSTTPGTLVVTGVNTSEE